MKRVVRILTGLLAVLAIALVVCIFLALIGWPVSPERLTELLSAARRMPNVLLTVSLALLLAAIGVFTLYALYAERFSRQTAATIERNAMGETSVSFSALSELATGVAKSRPDVKDCKTSVSSTGDRVRISVRVVTSPTVSLLELTYALQNAISKRILEVCGTPIGTVDVRVDQTDAEQKHARVN